MPGGAAHRAEPFGADELLGLMDEAGVDRAVLIPTSWSADGNELVSRAAAAHPEHFGVVAVLPFTHPESRREVARWGTRPGWLGLRAAFHTEQLAPLMTNGAADWLWPAAERAGVPLMVYAPHLLHHVGEIARRHPGLKLIVDHLGFPRPAPGINLTAAVDALERLAPLENVAVKASALPLFSHEPYPFRDVHEHVCRALEAFGPRRVFWGSDLTRLRCTYREAVGMMDALACLSPADRDLVLGRGLCDWLSWSV